MPENPLKRTFAYEEIEGPCVRENEGYGPENSVKPRRLLVKLRNPAQEDGPKNSAKCTFAHEELDRPEDPLKRSFASLEEDEENPSEAAITHAANRTLCCCNIIDKSLFRVPAYLVHIGSMMLFTFSFPTLIFFIVPRARFLGIEEYSAAFLLSVNAISDVIGRLSSGLLMSYRPSPVKRLWLAVIPLALLGLTSLVFPLATTYTLMLALCVLFGMFSGLFVPTIVTLIPDFVGIAKLPQALGTLLMFQGVMSLLGSPAVGWLFDVTGNYNVSFLLCGSTIVASALVRLAAHCIMGDMGLCSRSTADGTTQQSAVNTDEAEQRTLLKTVPPFNDEPVFIEVETTV
ncbi:monocarboxylate transporter 13-like [Branchiostoma floridae x Branchiostoma belcheri]